MLFRGAWVAQLVKRLTLAQVMISQFMSSSTASGSVLTAQSLESASEVSLVWGTWVVQSVKHSTLAQVMILQFVSSSPTSGSVLTAQSLEPGSDSVSSPLSLSLPCLHSVSLSLSQK